MKKFLALLLTLALLAGLTACKDAEAASTAQEQHTVTAPTNDATFVYQPDDPAATLPGGESVVLVTGPGGTESGEDAMLWQGIQTFANTYGYTADAQTAAGNTADEAEAALRAAAESGAKLVVCRGDTMGAALYRMQENYPDVHYLLFDSEPHSDDYSAYNTASLVHCVLFQEEQAGYLAGLRRRDGRLHHSSGFIGARGGPRRGAVRAPAFCRAAEAAAELQGAYGGLCSTWFAGTYQTPATPPPSGMLRLVQQRHARCSYGQRRQPDTRVLSGAAKETTGGNEVRVTASDYDQTQMPRDPRAGQRHQVLQRCRAAVSCTPSSAAVPPGMARLRQAKPRRPASRTAQSRRLAGAPLAV